MIFDVAAIAIGSHLTEGLNMPAYWVRRGANVHGPMSRAELKAGASNGQVLRTDQVSADQQRWLNAGSVPGLFADERAMPVEPPPYAESNAPEKSDAKLIAIIAGTALVALVVSLYFVLRAPSKPAEIATANPRPAISSQSPALAGSTAAVAPSAPPQPAPTLPQTVPPPPPTPQPPPQTAPAATPTTLKPGRETQELITRNIPLPGTVTDFEFTPADNPAKRLAFKCKLDGRAVVGSFDGEIIGAFYADAMKPATSDETPSVGNADVTKPAPNPVPALPTVPSELFARVVAKANVPPRLSDEASLAQSRIKLWEAEIVNGNTTEPIGFSAKPAAPLHPGSLGTGRPVGAHSLVQWDLGNLVTTALVENALGKPERTAQEEPIPFLLDDRGNRMFATVLWYGPVGFGVTRNRQKEEFLCMMFYAPKAKGASATDRKKTDGPVPATSPAQTAHAGNPAATPPLRKGPPPPDARNRPNPDPIPVNRRIPLEPFLKAFAEGKADDYKGYAVMVGGGSLTPPVIQHRGLMGPEGGMTNVLGYAKQAGANGSIYPLKRTGNNILNWNPKDRLLAARLVWKESELPQREIGVGPEVAFDKEALASPCIARFEGEYADLTVSINGIESKQEKMPVLVWVNYPGIAPEVVRRLRKSSPRPAGASELTISNLRATRFAGLIRMTADCSWSGTPDPAAYSTGESRFSSDFGLGPINMPRKTTGFVKKGVSDNVTWGDNHQTVVFVYPQVTPLDSTAGCVGKIFLRVGGSNELELDVSQIASEPIPEAIAYSRADLDDAAKAERDKLQGKWMIESCDFDGKPSLLSKPLEEIPFMLHDLKGMSLEIAGDTLRWAREPGAGISFWAAVTSTSFVFQEDPRLAMLPTTPPGEYVQGTWNFSLSKGKKAKQIHWGHEKAGVNAIYRIDRDMLTLCYSREGPAPETFVGDRLVFRRVPAGQGAPPAPNAGKKAAKDPKGG